MVRMLISQDDSLLACWRYRRSETHSIAAPPFTPVDFSRLSSADDDAAVIQVHRPKDTVEGTVPWTINRPDGPSLHVMHVFPADHRFKPKLIDINGRKGRRVVCVLGDDLKTYKIFDLDSAEGDPGETTLEHAALDEDAVMSD